MELIRNIAVKPALDATLGMCDSTCGAYKRFGFRLDPVIPRLELSKAASA
jgi:hypothetical protein